MGVYLTKGASTRLDGKLVRILNAELIPDVTIENRVCGKVIFVENSMPIIVCGEGLLLKFKNPQNMSQLFIE